MLVFVCAHRETEVKHRKERRLRCLHQDFETFLLASSSSKRLAALTSEGKRHRGSFTPFSLANREVGCEDHGLKLESYKQVPKWPIDDCNSTRVPIGLQYATGLYISSMKAKWESPIYREGPAMTAQIMYPLYIRWNGTFGTTAVEEYWLHDFWSFAIVSLLFSWILWISLIFKRFIIRLPSEKLCRMQEMDSCKANKLRNVHRRVYATNSMVFAWCTGKMTMNLTV